MNKFLKIGLLALIMGCASMAWACDDDDSDYPTEEFKPSGLVGDYTEGINGITVVDSSKSKGGTSKSGKELDYINNEDSTIENRNKMRLNAASQAIALGQHAVSLAAEAGEKDIEPMRKEIENRDDILRMLKGIAKLQAQHLQKTNAITAMRAKLSELNAIDDIVSGSIYTTKKSK